MFNFRAPALLACLLAGPAHAINLVQAYEAALKQDAAIRSARASRDAGLATSRIARSALLPQVDATYSDGRNRLRSNENNVLTGTGNTRSNSLINSVSNSDRQTTSTTTLLDEPSGTTTSSNSSIRTDATDTASSTSAINRDSNVSATERLRAATSSGSIQLRQPLFNAEALMNYRQAESLKLAADEDYMAREQDLARRVVEAYVEILFQRDNLRLAQTRLETLDLQQERNRRLLAGGQGTSTEVLETQSKREVARATVIEAHDSYVTARNRLAVITGQPVTEVEPLRITVGAGTAEMGAVSSWTDRAKKNNALLKSLNFRVEAARQSVRKADSGHLPTVELVASYTHERLRAPLTQQSSALSTTRQDVQSNSSNSSSQSISTESTTSSTDSPGDSNSTNSTTNSTTSSNTSTTGTEQGSSATSLNEAGLRRTRSNSAFVGVRLNVPIFSGGATLARQQQAAAQFAQAEAERDGVSAQLFAELDKEFRLVQSAERRAEALRQAVAAARFSIEATSKSMSAGLRTNLDVLSAREQFIASQRDYIVARYGQLLAYVRLHSLAGTLTPAVLKQIASPDRSEDLLVFAETANPANPAGMAERIAPQAAAAGQPAASATASAATPAAIPAVAPAGNDPAVAEREAILGVIERWRSAWESRDVAAYLDVYSSGFAGDAGNPARWREGRRRALSQGLNIRVGLGPVQLSSVDGERVKADFVQTYQRNGYADQGNKSLILQRVGNRWLITKETFAAVNPS